MPTTPNPTNEALEHIHTALTNLQTLIPRLPGERVTVTLPDTWNGIGGQTFTGTVDKVNRKPSDITGKSLSIFLDENQANAGRLVGVSPLDVRILTA